MNPPPVEAWVVFDVLSPRERDETQAKVNSSASNTQFFSWFWALQVDASGGMLSLRPRWHSVNPTAKSRPGIPAGEFVKKA
jgi:hypothetical protein